MSELATALRELYARAPKGMRLGLDAMREVCAAFDHPERAFEVVHVAGTNGKGSVCAMVDAMARAAGRKTALYTSPHLCRFSERIRIDGAPIDDRALAAHLTSVLRACPELTFFEAATLTAFLAFRAAGVELAVVEVGIGGRLDATNVVPPPRATAITRIAFDHMDKLGDTLVAIAREKAGIVKRAVPLVVGPLEDDVRRAILEIVHREGATMHAADADVEARAILREHPVALSGAFQYDNAQVACVLARHAGLDRRAIARGLAEVRWAGRIERITSARGTVFLLDAAHNPDGAAALAAHLATDPRERVLVFGALGDKAWEAMLDALVPHSAHRVYVAPPVAGGARVAVSPDAFAHRHPGSVAASVDEAMRIAEGHALEVVVAGSIYLVGAVRAQLLDLERDPPVGL